MSEFAKLDWQFMNLVSAEIQIFELLHVNDGFRYDGDAVGD